MLKPLACHSMMSLLTYRPWMIRFQLPRKSRASMSESVTGITMKLWRISMRLRMHRHEWQRLASTLEPMVVVHSSATRYQHLKI